MTYFVKFLCETLSVCQSMAFHDIINKFFLPAACRIFPVMLQKKGKQLEAVIVIRFFFQILFSLRFLLPPTFFQVSIHCLYYCLLVYSNIIHSNNPLSCSLKSLKLFCICLIARPMALSGKNESNSWAYSPAWILL